MPVGLCFDWDQQTQHWQRRGKVLTEYSYQQFGYDLAIVANGSRMFVGIANLFTGIDIPHLVQNIF